MMGWKTIVWLLVGILGLWFTGFIVYLWALAGLIIFILLWGYVVSQVPATATAQRKLINWGFGIFLVLSILATAGSNVYKNYIEPRLPENTFAALERARIAADMEGALKANPQMLKSRLEMMTQLQRLQNHIGEKHQAQIWTIRQRLQNGDITPEQAWIETMAIAKEEKKYRDQTLEAVSGLSPVSPWSLGSKAALAGLFLLAVVIFVPAGVTLPGRKLVGLAAVLLLLTALGLWMFPELQPVVAGKLPARGGGNKVAPSHGQPSVISTGITLKPGQEIYASKSQAGLPAPAWIVKAKDGNNRRIPWPEDEISRKIKNDHPSEIEILLELPPGLQENHLAWRRW